MFVKDSSGHFEVCGPMVRISQHWPAFDINHIVVIQIKNEPLSTRVSVELVSGSSFTLTAESVPAVEAFYNYIAQFKAKQMAGQTA